MSFFHLTDVPYRVRCTTYLSKDDGEKIVVGSTDAVSFLFIRFPLKICFALQRRVAQSNLQEVLLLAIDSERERVLSLTPMPLIMNYDAEYMPVLQVGERVLFMKKGAIVQELTNSQWNATIRVTDVMEGIMPETQAYIQRMEEEKRARQQGEAGDNRSFFAKYWMYIVPLVIFVLISNAMTPPEGQQQ